MKIKVLLALLVSIVVLVIASHELIRAASSIPEGYVNIYGNPGGYVNPPCNPTTDPQKCNQYHLQGNNCSPSGKYCEAKDADWAAMFLCNGGGITNCDTGMVDKGQNKKLYIGNRHCGQTIQIDVFDHNCEANGGWSCAEPKDYLVYYTGDCAAPTTTPPATPACNTDCSQDVSICDQASGGCTYCNPTSNKCETPPVSTPSPTSGPQCGADCSAVPDICQQAGGGCNYCNPNAGYTCTTPPSSSPPPGSSPSPSSPPPPSQPPASPTQPPFDENWCSCDGVSVGQIIAGMPVVVTANGKVDPPHVNDAKITGVTFSAYEGTKPPVGGPVTIPAKQIAPGSSSSPAKYQAQWTWDVPTTLQRGVDYRIGAQLRCKATNTAINYPYTTVVLASSTENKGFLSTILGFFQNLFGGKTTQPERVQDTSKTIYTTQDVTTTQDDTDSLQLKTFTPARVLDKTCSFVKFRFD